MQPQTQDAWTPGSQTWREGPSPGASEGVCVPAWISDSGLQNWGGRASCCLSPRLWP